MGFTIVYIPWCDDSGTNNENDCKKIVQFIDEILTNVNNLDRVNEIKIDVNNYMRKFPMFKV